MLKRHERTSARIRVSKSIMSCWISEPPLKGRLLNVSEQGAKLEIEGAPDEFVLFLTEETKRPCRVIWRDGQQLGVVFDPKIKRSKNNGVMEVDTVTTLTSASASMFAASGVRQSARRGRRASSTAGDQPACDQLAGIDHEARRRGAPSVVAARRRARPTRSARAETETGPAGGRARRGTRQRCRRT